MAKKARRRSWGRIDRLPSGRYRVSYLHNGQLWSPPRRTFAASIDAEGYLTQERALIDSDRWTPPANRTTAAKGQTTAQYAAERVAARELSPRTRKHYESILRLHVDGTELGRSALTAVTPEQIEQWYAGLPTAPTARAHAYGLVHSVFADAVRNRRRDTNPATLQRAQNSKRKARIRALTPKQLVCVADAPLVIESRSWWPVPVGCAPVS